MWGFPNLIFTVYVIDNADRDNKELNWIKETMQDILVPLLFFFWFSTILGTVALWLFCWIHSVVLFWPLARFNHHRTYDNRCSAVSVWFVHKHKRRCLLPVALRYFMIKAICLVFPFYSFETSSQRYDFLKKNKSVIPWRALTDTHVCLLSSHCHCLPVAFSKAGHKMKPLY